MRVLFVGSTQGTACSLHYFTALVRLGHEVLPFDPAFFQSGSLADRALQKLRGKPSPTRCRRASQRLLALCQRNRFDAVLVLAENFFDESVFQEIKALKPKSPKLLYHSHDNNFAPGILKSPHFFEGLKVFDAVFTTKSQNVARYKEAGQPRSYFIPSAYEPTVHRPLSEEERSGKPPIGISFVGTFDHSRAKYLNAVGWENLHVWGSDWTRWKGYGSHRKQITPQPIYYHEFAEVLNRSQCALGLLRDEAEDRHTQRTFEIPACGALQIAPRNAEILSFFEEDREIVCFDSLEELKEKSHYYLENPTRAKQIAKAGHHRCVAGEHTYQDRVRKMLRVG